MRVWADQEWGTEVLGDLIFRAGGFLAFSLAYVAVTWVGFWFIWRRIALERVPALIAGGCIAVAAAAGIDCVISTGDKDLAQLVCPHVTLVNTMSNEVLDEAGVLAKFGVPPCNGAPGSTGHITMHAWHT